MLPTVVFIFPFTFSAPPVTWSKASFKSEPKSLTACKRPSKIPPKLRKYPRTLSRKSTRIFPMLSRLRESIAFTRLMNALILSIPPFMKLSNRSEVSRKASPKREIAF